MVSSSTIGHHGLMCVMACGGFSCRGVSIEVETCDAKHTVTLLLAGRATNKNTNELSRCRGKLSVQTWCCGVRMWQVPQRSGMSQAFTAQI